MIAREAAQAGVAALRFDYSGTGDSTDLDPEADQLAVWSQDIITAAGELRRHAGVDRVCLLGIRLGALLATLAALQSSGAIEGLVAIGPIVEGRKYLRQLLTMRLAASLRASAEVSGTRTLLRQARDAGPIEIAGYNISAVTAAALERIDLAAMKQAPAPAMLVVDGDTMPTARRWAESLTELGVQAKYLALPGLAEMAMTAPQFAAVPQQIVGAVTDWLAQLSGAPAPVADESPLRSGVIASSTEVLTLTEAGGVRATAITERPIFLKASTTLFGIVTEPRQGEKRRRAVILLNSAADYHIGAGRMYVSLARKWARRGYFVLRFDLGGIGDSDTARGRPEDEVFPPKALEDTRAAIDFLRLRYGIGDVTLMGLCSGAYHALRAAVAELPVNRILMVNPLNYFWQEGMELRELQLAEIVRFPSVYRRRLFSFEHWRKLLTGQGQVGIWRVLSIYFHRMRLALESTGRGLARAARIRLPQDLGWELQAVAARRVSIVFVFANGEPGIALLKLLAGSILGRIKDACRVHVIDSADHIFGCSGPRTMLEQVLSQELFAPSEIVEPLRPQAS